MRLNQEKIQERLWEFAPTATIACVIARLLFKNKFTDPFAKKMAETKLAEELKLRRQFKELKGDLRDEDRFEAWRSGEIPSLVKIER